MNPDINRLRHDLGIQRSHPPTTIEDVDLEMADENLDVAPIATEGTSNGAVIGYILLTIFIIVAAWFILPILFSFVILLIEIVVAIVQFLITFGMILLVGAFVLCLFGIGSSRS